MRVGYTSRVRRVAGVTSRLHLNQVDPDSARNVAQSDAGKRVSAGMKNNQYLRAVTVIMPSFEPLEGRRLFTSVLDAGVLTVSGTDESDAITITLSGSNLRVVHNGGAQDFATASVQRIVIQSAGGDDTVDCSGVATLTSIDAGAGNDWINGSGGNDTIDAGLGDDRAWGNDGYDKIVGGDGDDFLGGGAQKDTIDGGLGRDRLNGHGGNDKLFGNAGVDRLYGYAGQDYLDGGSSDDRLEGGDGFDILLGQGGADRFLSRENEGDALYGGGDLDTATADVEDGCFSVETVSVQRIAKGGTAVLLEDYAALPLSGRAISSIDFAGQLGRVNFLRSEPSDAPSSDERFFVNDLNRNLYILDASSRSFATYMNFQAIFPKFDNSPGFAAGLVTFAFDPEYASNGKFYTVHTEDPLLQGPAIPNNFPGFDNAGYTTTAAVNPPAGTVVRDAVLIEWSDANISNTSFEGSAREILRVGFNANFHPMADLIFNPLARPGDADYRNLYIANGDGRAGELPDPLIHPIPQRLDTLQGKILRITPDLSLRPVTSTISANGRYRIPTSGADPNPFVGISGARREVFAYGLRNPHRMDWDDASNKLIVTDIGLRAWEEVNIIRKGGNYGYGDREGTEQLFVGGPNDQKTGGQTDPPTPYPIVDTLPVAGIGNVTPTYPVAQYRTGLEGDAISSGFVYRGSLMPELQGKYVFGEITTGRLFYCDLSELIAADDGDRTTLATIRELHILYDSPHQGGEPIDRRMFDIVADEYADRGGDPRPDLPEGRLPGFGNVTGGYLDGVFNPGVGDVNGVPYGGGRADIRLAEGADGEIYVLSKSDGMIRALTGARLLPDLGPEPVSPTKYLPARTSGFLVPHGGNDRRFAGDHRPDWNDPASTDEEELVVNAVSSTS